MIEELIDARYTVVQTVLEHQLSAWFGADNFQILVRTPRRLRMFFCSRIYRNLQTTMLNGKLRYQEA